jgi:DNA mismatch endonuclease, patch repair protein
METKLRAILGANGFGDTSPTRSRMMAAVHGKQNRSTEQKVRMLLVRNRISGWRLNEPQLPGKPDFYFPQHRVAMFIDGCFWHACPTCGHLPKTNRPFWRAKLLRNKQRDRLTKRKLLSNQIEVMRIWEHELTSRSQSKVIIRLRRLLHCRRVETTD